MQVIQSLLRHNLGDVMKGQREGEKTNGPSSTQHTVVTIEDGEIDTLWDNDKTARIGDWLPTTLVDDDNKAKNRKLRQSLKSLLARNHVIVPLGDMDDFNGSSTNSRSLFFLPSLLSAADPAEVSEAGPNVVMEPHANV